MDTITHEASTRRLLQNLRERSACGYRYFVPEGSLKTTLTKDAIHSLLSEDPTIVPEKLAQKVNDVHSKALKVFATLILMESNKKLEIFLDRKLYDCELPFTKDHFDPSSTEALGDRWVEDFLFRQHIFLAPVFVKGASHDSMDSKYVLPFTGNERIGQGAFGVVYKVQIHPSHQRLLASPNGKFEGIWFARKEFKITPDYKDVFEREKGVLEQFLKLEHPNIVPLLATYSHDNNFNMIFPLAEMTLYEYLDSDDRHPSNDSSMMLLFERIYDIVQALHHIHNPPPIKGETEARFLGYHHDLKPRNILVQEGKFLIADFGLANLKNTDQSSKTFIACTGAYSPPEARCGVAGRAYDIWSLACILAEFATFAVQGAEGVRCFGEQRTTRVTPSMSNDYFHGGTEVKPEVLQHFDKLKSLTASQSGPLAIIPQLLTLVEHMLEPIADKRPTSADVLESFGEMLGRHERRSSVNPTPDTSESLRCQAETPAQQTITFLSPPSPPPPKISRPSQSISGESAYVMDQAMGEDTALISHPAGEPGIATHLPEGRPTSRKKVWGVFLHLWRRFRASMPQVFRIARKDYKSTKFFEKSPSVARAHSASST